MKCNDSTATPAEVTYSNWYNTAMKLVVSGTLPEDAGKDVMIIREHPENELLEIKQTTGKDIVIFGSPTLSKSLMESDLIDEFRVFIHPSFFGQGMPLFAGLQEKVDLKLLNTHTLSNGEIALHYVKNKP